MKAEQDAVGRAMLDFLEGRGGSELLERDDGTIEPSGGPEVYTAGEPTYFAVIEKSEA